jgi:two-component system, response regulator
MTREDQLILLVEDNDDDAELANMAFRRAKIANPVHRARDGVEALDYLFAQGAYLERDVNNSPAVVLLDLNLPKLSGLEVLKAVRADERTRHLPIVVLTSSSEERDLIGAYDLYANSYVIKPVDFDEFVAAARQLGHYWLGLNMPAATRHY